MKISFKEQTVEATPVEDQEEIIEERIVESLYARRSITISCGIIEKIFTYRENGKPADVRERILI